MPDEIPQAPPIPHAQRAPMMDPPPEEESDE